MVETIANLPQEKMKMFAGHSAERIEPVLRIAPEALDPVDVVPSLGPTSLLADHHMIPLDAQRTICMPVIGVVQTARPSMSTNQADDPISFPCGNGEYLPLTVALQDPQHDDLAGGSPTALAPPGPANRGLVALDGSPERFAQFLDMRTAGPDQTIEAFDRRSARGGPESLPVHRNSQHEKFQKPTLRRLRQPDRRPYSCPRVPSPAGLALESSVGQFVSPGMTASFTSSHGQTRIENLVRFGITFIFWSNNGNNFL